MSAAGQTIQVTPGEVGAMAALEVVLEPLGYVERQRVLHWAQDRWSVAGDITELMVGTIKKLSGAIRAVTDTDGPVTDEMRAALIDAVVASETGFKITPKAVTA